MTSPKHGLNTGFMRNKGFTLVEVLVAIAIIALVLTSVGVILARSHNNTLHMNKKMAADIAARNLMDKFRMDIKQNLKPKVKQNEGEVKMAGFNFAYRQEITPTASDDLKKLDIIIMDLDSSTRLRTLSMYIAK